MSFASSSCNSLMYSLGCFAEDEAPFVTEGYLLKVSGTFLSTRRFECCAIYFPVHGEDALVWKTFLIYSCRSCGIRFQPFHGQEEPVDLNRQSSSDVSGKFRKLSRASSKVPFTKAWRGGLHLRKASKGLEEIWSGLEGGLKGASRRLEGGFKGAWRGCFLFLLFWGTPNRWAYAMLMYRPYFTV